MKRIVLSLIVLALAGSVAIGATRAYFSDTETSTGNTFSAGTLDLNLDSGNTNVVKFTVSNKAPGDTGTGTWTIKNVGTVNGFLDVQPITLSDDDNNCNEPEAAVPDATCGSVGGGDLSANMNVDLFVDANNNTIYDVGGDTPIYTGLLSGIATAGYDSSIALNAGATNYITLNWGIPTTAGNIIQSDSSTLGMTFELGQTAAQ
ncbi:MAG: TasA family protein [Patescibacteria group bacterium]